MWQLSNNPLQNEHICQELVHRRNLEILVSDVPLLLEGSQPAMLKYQSRSKLEHAA